MRAAPPSLTRPARRHFKVALIVRVAVGVVRSGSFGKARMFNAHLIFVALAFCALTSGASAREKPAPAAPPSPALWRVSDADSSLILFGTIGTLPKGAAWRSRSLAAAIDEAETLWFEAPVGEAAGAARAGEIFTAEGSLPRGRELPSLLGEAHRQAFAAVVASAGLAPGAIDPLKPWAAFVVLSSRVNAGEGLDPSEGVDAALLTEAQSRDRKVRYFSTIEETLGVLTKMPEKAQVDLLGFLIDDWAEQQVGAGPAFEAWRVGDVEATDDFLNRAMRERAPAAYQRLVASRNEQFADAIAEILKGQATAFAALSANFTVGEGALPELLAARGFTVERIGAKPAPALRD